VFNSLSASISMSGTIEPKSYTFYMGLTKTIKKMSLITLPYSFPVNNFKILFGSPFSTKFERRNPIEFLNIKTLLTELLDNIPGKIGVFFPSYDLLSAIMLATSQTNNEQYVIEKPHQSLQEYYSMLDSFKNTSKSTVLFGICGGRSAEGEDFPNNIFNAIIIVGIPFKEITPYESAIMKYFENECGVTNHIYSQITPAMTKVNQTIGRGLRSASDRLLVYLIDERYEKLTTYLCPWYQKRLENISLAPQIILHQIKSWFGIRPQLSDPIESWIEFYCVQRQLQEKQKDFIRKYARMRIKKQLPPGSNQQIAEYVILSH